MTLANTKNAQFACVFCECKNVGAPSYALQLAKTLMYSGYQAIFARDPSVGGQQKRLLATNYIGLTRYTLATGGRASAGVYALKPIMFKPSIPSPKLLIKSLL